MTITIKKLHIAIAVLAVALIAPTTALATHDFDDVPDSKFYAGPIEWALANAITTGSPAGASTFKPEDPVTRGEGVTFLKRYDDNIVQPALDEIDLQFSSRPIVSAYGDSSGDGVLGGPESVIVNGISTLQEIDIEVGMGSLMINNSLSFSGANQIWMWVTVDEACAVTGGFADPVGAVLGTYAADLDLGTGSLAGGGLHSTLDGSALTVRLCANTTGATTVLASALNVLYVPDPGV